jgi:hypothetical protein
VRRAGGCIAVFGWTLAPFHDNVFKLCAESSRLFNLALNAHTSTPIYEKEISTLFLQHLPQLNQCRFVVAKVN